MSPKLFEQLLAAGTAESGFPVLKKNQEFLLKYPFQIGSQRSGLVFAPGIPYADLTEPTRWKVVALRYVACPPKKPHSAAWVDDAT